MSVQLPAPDAPWDTVKLSYIADEMGGSTPSKSEERFWNGEVPWVSPKDMKTETICDSIDHVTRLALRETSLRLVPSGAVLLVVRGMILAHTVPVALTEAPVTLNQDMKALVPRGGVDGRFLRYALQAHQDGLLALVEEAGHGTRCLRSELWRKYELALPPLAVQRRITGFLDRKTAAIDALIEKKQKLLDLLAEKRAALINQAVTKGLDPEVPMKDSGIPWIGEIPTHWEIQRLKHIASHLTVGVVVNPSTYVADDGSIPFIYGSNISEGAIDVSTARRISEASNRQLRKTRLRAGDLVCVRVGEPGVTSVVPPELDNANCASVMIVRQGKAFSSPWLQYAMNSLSGRHNISLVAYGAAQKQFNISHAVDFLYAVPPQGEQEEIAVALGRTEQKLSRIASIARIQLERLREFRQALITAAVTGQIDVTEEAAA